MFSFLFPEIQSFVNVNLTCFSKENIVFHIEEIQPFFVSVWNVVSVFHV